MEWLENLRKLKDETNETYKSIAEKTKIPQTTIEKLFNGRTKDPKLFMIKEVVHCLGYTLDDLLEYNSSENSTTKLSSEEKKILNLCNKLNAKGQQKVNDYINDLLVNPNYTKNDIISKDIIQELSNNAKPSKQVT